MLFGMIHLQSSGNTGHEDTYSLEYEDDLWTDLRDNLRYIMRSNLTLTDAF